jgi:hypothetical protein
MYLAALVALILVVAAYFAVRRWRKRERFSLSTPASPAVCDASAQLFGGLKAIVSLQRSFLDATTPKPETMVVPESLRTIRPSVEANSAALETALHALVDSPPTYANYLAIHQGLSGADRALLAAADTYAARAAATKGHPAALTLAAIGTQMRSLVASVHRLGAALDVE